MDDDSVAIPEQNEELLISVIRQAQEGDTAALHTLYERFQRRIYNVLYGVVGNEDDAVELTQDTFVKAFNSLHRLDHPQAFNTWLHTIALNLGRDFLRRKRHIHVNSIDQKTETEDSELDREIPDDRPGPEEQAATSELYKALHEAIQELSPNHRAVIVLHHLQGMELVDIAKIMGCRLGTVKSRLARARDHLKRKLRRYEE